MYKKVILNKGRESSLLRKHPWVFSGGIKKIEPNIQDGEIVDVLDVNQNFLAKGHYQHGGSIVVRILSFENIEINQSFWDDTIKKAFLYRSELKLTNNNETNAFRLIHGEGDGIPGLVIDVYNNIIVIQCHSIGAYLNREEIGQSIQKVFQDKELSIYCRAKDTLPEFFSQHIEDHFIIGSESETLIQENNCTFKVNVIEGQKTGFFLDQRENRNLIGQFANNKTVLNAFCYTGGFSIYALLNGAKKVDSVDVSEKAMILADENVRLNNHKSTHQSFQDNVMLFLNNPDTSDYDMVIIDPPAFAKSLHKRHNAVQAYKRLNIMAMKKVNPGGLLFTFSCSQVVTPQLFYDTIIAAGIESGRTIRIAKQLGQGPDHPINLFHPEGHYLKGLMLYIE